MEVGATEFGGWRRKVRRFLTGNSVQSTKEKTGPVDLLDTSTFLEPTERGNKAFPVEVSPVIEKTGTRVIAPERQVAKQFVTYSSPQGEVEGDWIGSRAINVSSHFSEDEEVVAQGDIPLIEMGAEGLASALEAGIRDDRQTYRYHGLEISTKHLLAALRGKTSVAGGKFVSVQYDKQTGAEVRYYCVPVRTTNGAVVLHRFLYDDGISHLKEVALGESLRAIGSRRMVVEEGNGEHKKESLENPKTGRQMVLELLMGATWEDFDFEGITASGERLIDEDVICLLQVVLPNGAKVLLAAVVDGMGGQGDGDVASMMAMLGGYEGLTNMRREDWMEIQKQASGNKEELMRLLADRVINEMNLTVFGWRKSSGSEGGAAAAVALISEEGVGGTAYVGDCRIYKDGVCQQPEDHSLAARLVAAKQYRADDWQGLEGESAMSQIYRCLGDRPTVEAVSGSFKLAPGESIAGCCDGIWGAYSATVASSGDRIMALRDRPIAEVVRNAVLYKEGGPHNGGVIRETEDNASGWKVTRRN